MSADRNAATRDRKHQSESFFPTKPEGAVQVPLGLGSVCPSVLGLINLSFILWFAASHVTGMVGVCKKSRPPGSNPRVLTPRQAGKAKVSIYLPKEGSLFLLPDPRNGQPQTWMGESRPVPFACPRFMCILTRCEPPECCWGSHFA